MDVIVGTAGHIDHGKTALVKALTGVDADRLPEEKQRGITIDLGFAELELGDIRIGFVDVPGHERFVKNMLAGASGIDLVALVIAADEGVMPQTREHFEICRLLETRRGLIIITKTDLVEREFLELVELDASGLVEGSFLEKAPVVRVSAKTGEGIEELRETLRKTAIDVPPRARDKVARLPIDRCFSIKGFGAVVTGTLANGSLAVGNELDLLPVMKKVRVRGLETHGRRVEEVSAGQRSAVNLTGIDHTEISRGMVLAESGVLSPTQIFDAALEVLSDAKRPVRTRQRVRVHMGTVEALARIEVLNEKKEIGPGEKDLVQIRLESPVCAVPSERFILRQYSPQITIAGGRVINAHAAKHKRKDLPQTRERLTSMAASAGDPAANVEAVLSAAGIRGHSFAEIQARTGWRKDVISAALGKMAGEGIAAIADTRYVAASAIEGLRNVIVGTLEAHHQKEPLARGMQGETLREKAAAHLPVEVYRLALALLEQEGAIAVEKETVRLASHKQDLSEEESRIRTRLSGIYRNAGLRVPVVKEALAEAISGEKMDAAHARKILRLLVDSAELVKVSDDLYFSNAAIRDLAAKLKERAAATGEKLISVPEFKEMAGISRKYAIPLLEYLDAVKVTRRAADKRIIL